MTTRFFPGSHDPDANNLNALLDAMRSGTRAPDAASTSEEATDLAATASQFRTLDDRAKTAAAANDTTFDTIWEDMMIAHTITSPIELAGAPPTRATRIDQRVHPVPPQPQTSWLQSLFSAAIVAIMIVGLISAAWNLRGDTGGGGGSDESARLAATALDGTPEASPEADAGDWWSWITAKECVPTEFPDYDARDAEPQSGEWDWAESQYIPFTQPSQQGAVAVASVAREIEACQQAGLPVAQLQSDRYRRGDAMQDPDYVANYYRLSHEISDAYPITDPEEFIRTTTDEPVFATPSALMRRAGLVRDPLPFVYIPDQAVTLADGRIGIPAAALLSEGSPASDARLESLEQGVYQSNLLIFTNEDGEWVMDGELTLCIGECNWLWEMYEATASPEAPPESSPATSSDNWLTWVPPDECVVEPMSEDDFAGIMRQEPDAPTLTSRSYTVADDADPAAAAVVAQTAREYEACSISRMTDQKRALESPFNIYVSNGGAVSYQTPQERRAQEINHGKELSAQLPVQDPAHYIAVNTSEEPPQPQFMGNVFEPSNAVLLEDGRIAIPGTKLFASEPLDPFHPGGISIFIHESGEWLLDEAVPFCVGDCEAYWAKFEGGRLSGDATPYASPAVTPEGSPEADAFWLNYVVRGSQLCTNTSSPLTSSERRALLSENREWPAREYTPLEPVPDDITRDVAQAARDWEAGCGDMSDHYVWEQGSRYAPSFGERVEQRNVAGDKLSAAYPIQEPSAFIFLTEQEPDFGIGRSIERGFIATQTYVPGQVVMLADGRVAVPGSVLIWKDDPNAPIDADGTIEMADYFSSTMWILIQEDGEWKIDEMVDFCVGNCTDTFGRPMFPEPGAEATPPAIPDPSPAANVDWLSWVMPEECTVEPMSREEYASIMRQEAEASEVFNRSYTVAGPADPADAAAVAETGREYEACKLARQNDERLALETPVYIYLRNGGATSYQTPQERHTLIAEHSEELSAQLPIQDPSHYIAVTTSEDPPTSQFNGNVFEPGNALRLEDGRIALPATWMSPDDRVDPQSMQSFAGIYIFTDESGQWKVDELLSYCVGDCDEVWDGMAEVRLAGDATPAASPRSTPED